MKKNPNFMTTAEVKKREEQVVGRCLTLMLACLMDEYDLEDYDLELVMDRFSRYSDAVTDHTISVKQVAGIIKDKTGITVKWY